MTTINGSSGPRVLSALPQAKNAEVPLEELAPWITKYAGQYGANPELVAAVIAQESSFINHQVHRDGTGHGLIGLDDNGLLPDFERWSGLTVGRGRSAATIPPEKQVEFLAMKLGELTERLGDEWEAVRAWHAGVGGRNRSYANDYEALIRGHVPEVADAVRPTSSAKPPQALLAARDSGFDAPRAEKVRLDDANAGTPVRGGIDYERG